MGETPESWDCIDCGFNTGPGMPTKQQLGAICLYAKAEIPAHINSFSEVYTVRNKVWEAAGNPDGCLCIGCLEKRLKRRLKPKDFQRGHPFNDPEFPGTPRLLDRRGISWRMP